ncbi:MAG: hypothetical protein IMZ53_04285, partial [Thermoplasmata archaeon]|nr:hypothetical protein [Thermoplasmata archaeon]
MIQGDATTVGKVDYTISTLVANIFGILAQGQLPNAIGTIASAIAPTSVLAITLVNTNVTAETINLYYTPFGGTARRIIAKDTILQPGYSLVHDGGRYEIHDTSGALITAQSIPITTLGVLSAKNPPIDADKVIYRDSVATDSLVTSTWVQIKDFLKTYFDSLYDVLGTVSTHAALLTGIHGLAITAGKTLTVSLDASVSGTNTGDQGRNRVLNGAMDFDQRKEGGVYTATDLETYTLDNT